VVRPDKVENTLSNLKGYLEKLKRLAILSREEFLSDFTKVESAKHLFQVSVECCIDVANHIIASERFPVPKSYAESFETLAEKGILPNNFVPTLRQMVQFRNRLVHLYWDVDAEVIHELLQRNLTDFDPFAKHILDYMANTKSE